MPQLNKAPQQTTGELDRRQASWLAALALVIFAPLVWHLPLWLNLMAGLALFWFALLLWRQAPLPSRWLLTFMALSGPAGITLHYHTLFGRDPGVACLVLMFALKLLEMRTRRDAFVLILLGYFLSMTQFFHLQNILAAVLMLATVLQTTATLIVLNQSAGSASRIRMPYRLAGTMLLQALPLMLLLFVLFPRIQGPLWGLPGDAYSGMTGLSDHMSPGSISQLSQSDAIAFRAKFSNASAAPPPRQQLYWRGPVLTWFDGRTWQRQQKTASRSLPYELHGGFHDYSVTLEAHNQPWLFALDLPGTIPKPGGITHNAELLAPNSVTARLRYEMRSYPEAALGAQDSATMLQEALQLPETGNPRTRALARQWRKEAGANDPAIVARMLEHYRREEFFYTLAPPLLGADTVDEFIFVSRRGFCEHYAASFVFIMRAAGIPARIVTGYQGGEINPVDATLVVRQSDAHAWAEIWLRGSGWQRIDPTAAIAPSRIEKNLVAALPAGEAAPLLLRPQFSWLHALRFRWEAFGNSWNQWVIGYNPQRQRELLDKLGLSDASWQQMTALLAGLCGLLLLVYTAWVLRQPQRGDAVQHDWQRFSHKLARLGLARQPWEGPQEYAQRAATALAPGHKKLSAEVLEIAAIYSQLRYAAPATEEIISQRNQLHKDLHQRISRLDELMP